MRNPFEVDWSQPKSAQVQRAEKRLPYSVTPIGGKAELAAWKVQRAEIDEQWRAEAEEKRKVVRAAIVAMVADQSATVTDADLEEIRAVKAMVEQKPKVVSEKFMYKFDQVSESVEKKSLAQKATKIISDFWNQAFDND